MLLEKVDDQVAVTFEFCELRSELHAYISGRLKMCLSNWSWLRVLCPTGTTAISSHPSKPNSFSVSTMDFGSIGLSSSEIAYQTPVLNLSDTINL